MNRPAEECHEFGSLLVFFFWRRYGDDSGIGVEGGGGRVIFCRNHTKIDPPPSARKGFGVNSAERLGRGGAEVKY